MIILVWVAAWTPFAMILLIQMAGYDYIVHNYVTILSKLFQYLGIKAVMVVQVVERQRQNRTTGDRVLFLLIDHKQVPLKWQYLTMG